MKQTNFNKSLKVLCMFSSIFTVQNASAIPTNSAIAESILNISAFTLRKTNGNVLTVGDLSLISSGDTTSKLSTTSSIGSNNVISSTDGDGGTDAGFGFNLKSYVDTTMGCTTFTCSNFNFPNPQSPDSTNFAKSYAAGSSFSTGNALVDLDGDTVNINSTVVLNDTGAGLSNSNQYLTGVKFRSIGNQDARISFDAFGFLNAQLGQNPSDENLFQGASASYSWKLTVERSNTINGSYSKVLVWNPDGRELNPCFGTSLGTCSNIQEGFNLNDTLTAQNREDGGSLTNELSHFNLDLNLVANKYYKLGLQHLQNASANFDATEVSEPTFISLLALGFLGLAGFTNKTARKFKLRSYQHRQNV